MSSNYNRASNANSQCARILAYANTHGSITSYECIYNLGILSPTRRVCDIRDRLGYTVNKTTETVINQFGEKCRIKRYRFTKGETK